MKRIEVDKVKCIECLNCRAILNVEEKPLSLEGAPPSAHCFEKMPMMAHKAFVFELAPEGALNRIKLAVSECPTGALSFYD